MAIAPAVLQGGIALATTATALYTATANAKVTAPAFTNTTAAAVTLTVSVTRHTGTAMVITSAASVPGNSVYLAPELSGLVLAVGDVISAEANTASAINAFLSGITGF